VPGLPLGDDFGPGALDDRVYLIVNRGKNLFLTVSKLMGNFNREGTPMHANAFIFREPQTQSMCERTVRHMTGARRSRRFDGRICWRLEFTTARIFGQ
jgi:hypothetical protein